MQQSYLWAGWHNLWFNLATKHLQISSVGPRHGVGAGYATLFVGILKEDFWLMAPMAFVLVTLAEKGGEGI